jgi:hypothetical protein
VTFVGIDNGVSGAVYALSEPHRYFNTPTKGAKRKFVDIIEIRNRLVGVLNPFLIIEAGQKNPEFGAVGNYSQGQSHGRLMALAELMGWPFVLVNPQMWQQPIFALVKNKEGCETTKDFSKQFYFEQTGKRIKFDGLTDAFCLAMYGKTKLGKK